jgi:hypothetical protein
MNKHEAIYKLYPNVVTIRGDVAYDANEQEVTYDEVAVQAEVDANAYIEKRRAEYPNITDYLDAIVKGDDTQKQAYIDACLAVKAKYPKGSV